MRALIGSLKSSLGFKGRLDPKVLCSRGLWIICESNSTSARNSLLESNSKEEKLIRNSRSKPIHETQRSPLTNVAEISINKQEVAKVALPNHQSSLDNRQKGPNLISTLQTILRGGQGTGLDYPVYSQKHAS